MRGRYERNPGRIVQLNPGESRDVLDLQWEDEIADVICVTLVGPSARKAGRFNSTVCVALVQWGAGEAEAEAEIDVGVGGVVFTVPASSIRITARCEQSVVQGETVPPPVRLGAFASVGSGARTSRLTRTRLLEADLAPGGSASVDVPPFAKAVRVLAGDQSTRAVRLDFFGVAAGPDYSIEMAPGSEAPVLDLSPDVTSVDITNVSGAVLPAGGRAIFELGI
jgi:hypothetical protein